MHWDDKGYGFLPYEYVVRGLTVDFWSLLKNEWVDTGEFGK
jgi:C1A family cysteine protease